MMITSNQPMKTHLRSSGRHLLAAVIGKLPFFDFLLAEAAGVGFEPTSAG